MSVKGLSKIGKNDSCDKDKGEQCAVENGM